MKKETYYKYKQIFEKNYRELKNSFSLSVPIELCLEGIRLKKEFIRLYSDDTRFIGTLSTQSVERFKRYDIGTGKQVSKIQSVTSTNLFKFEGMFESAVKRIKQK
jgi:hypothetical protein